MIFYVLAHLKCEMNHDAACKAAEFCRNHQAWFTLLMSSCFNFDSPEQI